MAVALTTAAVLVICASAVSLVLFFPLLALTAGTPLTRAFRHTQLWLAELLLPPCLAVGATAYGLTRQFLHPLWSPHAEHVRPHICLRPLLEGPDVQWRATLFCGLCLLLVLAAVVSLIVRLVRSAQESARLRGGGSPQPAPPWAPEADIVHTQAVALATHRGLARLVVVSPRLEQFFGVEPACAILAHEICHARRRDGLQQILAQTAVLLAGLSPLGYVAYRRWLQARELTCDLFAAGMTSIEVTEQALAQAGELAGVLGELSPLSAPPTAGLRALAQRREKLRLAASAPGRPNAWAGVGIVLAVVALLVVLRLLAGKVPDSLQCLAEGFLQVLK